jgi:hypothetical protein
VNFEAVAVGPEEATKGLDVARGKPEDAGDGPDELNGISEAVFDQFASPLYGGLDEAGSADHLAEGVGLVDEVLTLVDFDAGEESNRSPPEQRLYIVKGSRPRKKSR